MFGAICARWNGVKGQMAAGLKKHNNQRPGSQHHQMEFKEPTATNADTMWRLGMMGLLGTFVPNKNTDKENRR